MTKRSSADGAWRIGLAVLALGMAVHLWFYRAYVVDDAFISFRYADNWARGVGPVFNAGERVEGYTNFAWVAWLALMARLGIDVPLTSKLSSCALTMACLWMSLLLIRRQGGGPPIAITAGALIVSNGVFIRNGTNGLETSLLTFLCLTSLLLHPSRGWFRGVLRGTALGAIGLTRPDAILLLIAILAMDLMTTERSRLFREPGLWLPWLGCAVVLGIHEIWRWSFYGYPLPNTFYAKITGQSHWTLALRGVEVILSFLHTMGGVLTAPIATAAFIGGTSPVLIGTAGLVIARALFVLFSGGEYMEPHRFMAPVIPLLYILLAVGAARVWSRLGYVPSWRRSFLTATPLLLFNLWQGWIVQSEAARYQESLARCHVALGQWFASNATRGGPIAVGDVGAISYFSGLPVIDLWGLNDAHIAHRPGGYGEKVDLEYLWRRAPAYIVLWSNTQRARYSFQSGRTAHDRAIEGSPVFRRDYTLIGEGMFEPGSYQLIFKRSGSGSHER